MSEPLQKAIESLVQAALAEDVGPGDATTLAIVPEGSTSTAHLRPRQPIVACGLSIAETVFKTLDPSLTVLSHFKDGDEVEPDACLLTVQGSTASILTAERTALNFIQRLSGIATTTHDFVSALQGLPTLLLDTRKTTPGWRLLEKYAVACGGGSNHRIGLYDQILIKDNHLEALRHAQPNPIAAAVSRARSRFPHLRVEVEADTIEQVAQAAQAGADIILLDNMSLEQLRQSVAVVAGHAKTEASGGVSLATVRAIAETGVDFISVGALTHSAPSADIGLDFLPTPSAPPAP